MDHQGLLYELLPHALEVFAVSLEHLDQLEMCGQVTVAQGGVLRLKPSFQYRSSSIEVGDLRGNRLGQLIMISQSPTNGIPTIRGSYSNEEALRPRSTLARKLYPDRKSVV